MLDYRHFGLDDLPFEETAVSQPLYMSAAHREAFALLEWSLLHERSGCALLVGEPGTGKSTLLRALLNREYYKIRIACAANPAVTFDEFLREVMYDFGIGAGPSKRELLEGFDRFLSSIEPGGRAVVVVDNAQGFSDEALEEISLLLKRCAISERQIHFVLVGRRELARRLLQPGLCQLNESIGARSILDRMSRAEAFGYVEYWLQAVGGSARTVFGWRALAHIVEHGGNLPGRLNALCHGAMVLACAAKQRKVHLGAARQAAAQLGADSSGGYHPWFRSVRHRTAPPVASASDAVIDAGSLNRSPSVPHRI